MKKIEKINLVNPSVYIGYSPLAWELPDSIDRNTKAALIELQVKINKIIDFINPKEIQEKEEGK